MKIKARDGKTYEVKATGNAETFEVWLGADQVASFVIEEDVNRVRLAAAGKGKTTEKTIDEVANQFVDKGGAPMKMM